MLRTPTWRPLSGLICLGLLHGLAPAHAQDGGSDAGIEASDAGEMRDGGNPPDASTPDAGVRDSDGAAPPSPDISGIRGRIVDSTTGAGVPDAIVLARPETGDADAAESAVSDERGAYAVPLARGRYEVLSYADMYHGARMRRVVVRSGRFTDLTLTLEPVDAEVVVEEVEIVYRADTSSAAAQDQLRAAASGIGEGVGSAEMSRGGASDAASAAKKVVGVSLEGTNLNVRGLGGRYTLVLLNGVQLPSTDPDAPSVDLDLFPTSVIDNLQVSKTFLPTLPANFAGGVLNIRTVRFPTEFTFELGADVAFNTLSTFRSILTYQGGDLDWLGLDDGTRAFPGGREERISTSRTGRYQDLASIEEAAEAFPNIWQFERTTAAPPFSFGAVIGDSFDLGDDRRFGFLVTANYDYAQLRQLGLASPRPQIDLEGNLQSFNEYDVEWGTQNVQISLLGNASLEFDQENVLSFLTLYNRVMQDETQRQVGFSGELSGAVERWQLQYIARSLWFNQLRGDHRNLFGSRLRLKWGLYGSLADRDEPDRRTVTYGPQGASTNRWLEKSQSGERFYSELNQPEFGGTLDVRFPLWVQAWADVGAHLRTSSRDFVNRRLRMLQDPRNTSQVLYEQPVEVLFSPENIGEPNTLTRIQEFTRDNDSYTSTQNYLATYAQVETPLGSVVRFTTGVRLEVFSQFVSSVSPFAEERADGALRETDRTDINVLPGAAFRFEIAENMFVRAAYGMTVARPNIRELAPYQYYDFVRDRNISGNPDLNRTLIQNGDLRWEWFFAEGDVVALSLFYKYFDQPIELQIRNQMTYDSQFINARFAQNLGGELEFRFNLGHVVDSLSALSFNGNFTLMWSEVELPVELSGAVASSRPLVGQSPYVANLSLAFDEPHSGFGATVVYNLTGPRITDVGTRVSDVILPNIERAALQSLDLILSYRLAERFRVWIKLRNLLLQSQEFYQNDFLTQRVEPGMSGSLSLDFSY